ncbi:MAG: alpha/beta fold hydrolase [Bryobacteraceae bacterium]
MPYAVNKGTKLYWEEHGSGPPVLLIIGLSFTHEMWFRVVPLLGPRYRVILFDNRGTGRSDVPRGPYLIRQMASDAREILNAADVATADVIGASMGGMIAQELALRFPERVSRLVLACTSHGGLFSSWPEFSRVPRGIYATRPDDRERALIPLLYADTTPRDRIEEDLQIRSRCSWCYQGFFGQLTGILGWSSYRRLPKIDVPTLVIHGEQDRLVPPRNGRVLAARIPGAQFQLVPEAGHMLLTDQPEICAAVVRPFLGRQETAEPLTELARSE